jgi:CheY-like chemotaxis protein
MTTRPKILIVDDDIDFIEITKFTLEGNGYEVFSAESGPEGWEQVNREKPDLILMDLMMERIDAGMALSQKIKKRFPSIPILMLTSIARETGMDFSPRSAEEMKDLHVDDFCTKPIKAKPLLEKVEKLLGRRSEKGK